MLQRDSCTLSKIACEDKILLIHSKWPSVSSAFLIFGLASWASSFTGYHHKPTTTTTTTTTPAPYKKHHKREAQPEPYHNYNAYRCPSSKPTYKALFSASMTPAQPPSISDVMFLLGPSLVGRYPEWYPMSEDMCAIDIFWKWRNIKDLIGDNLSHFFMKLLVSNHWCNF